MTAITHPAPQEAIRKPFDPDELPDWSDPNSKVSRHFTVGEVTGKGDRPIPSNGQQIQIAILARELDKLREEWGNPVGVAGWDYNEQTADIYAMDGDPEEFEAWVSKRWGGVVGYAAKTAGWTRVGLEGGQWRKGDCSKRYTVAFTPTKRESFSGAIAEIEWNNPNAKISKYFTVGEVTQGDARRIPDFKSAQEGNIIKLARALDVIREEWGSPLGVTSWYRPPDINRAVGGVSNSWHLSGLAVDVYAMNLSTYDRSFEKWVEQRWSGGIGYGASNRGFTHLDLGPVRSWVY